MRLLCMSQIRMVLSSLPDTPRRQSGLNCAVRTQFACPLRVNMKRWLGSAHTLTVLSSEADMSIRPLEAKLTLRTVPECAAIVVDLPSLHPMPLFKVQRGSETSEPPCCTAQLFAWFMMLKVHCMKQQ